MRQWEHAPCRVVGARQNAGRRSRSMRGPTDRRNQRAGHFTSCNPDSTRLAARGIERSNSRSGTQEPVSYGPTADRVFTLRARLATFPVTLSATSLAVAELSHLRLKPAVRRRTWQDCAGARNG